jgi:hypothetical protein
MDPTAMRPYNQFLGSGSSQIDSRFLGNLDRLFTDPTLLSGSGSCSATTTMWSTAREIAAGDLVIIWLVSSYLFDRRNSTVVIT